MNQKSNQTKLKLILLNIKHLENEVYIQHFQTKNKNVTVYKSDFTGFFYIFNFNNKNKDKIL